MFTPPPPPGIGKTAITGRLEESLRGLVSGTQGSMSVKVLNSDKLKQANRNYQTNRYWHDVAEAADTYEGRGHQTVSWGGGAVHGKSSGGEFGGG